MASLNIDAGALDVTAQRGQRWSLVLTVRDSNDALVNLTGYDCTWTLAAAYGDTPILSGTSSDYLTMGGALGTIALDVPSSVTDVSPGTYLHGFELIIPGGERTAFLRGSWTVTGRVAA